MSQSQLALIDGALSIAQVLEQRKLVMSLMKEAMTEGQHYGVIPGCGSKPSLLQPGAQLMATTFRLFPSYVITTHEPAPGHMAFTVVCTMLFQGTKIAEGVGYCSSMESKHRYRNSDALLEDTGDPVPKAYWDNPDKKAALAALSQDYDGQKVATKKTTSGWHVFIVKGGGDVKCENPNPADVFNTILKMAKKRAYVDATISATACNDLFTQDLEDIRDNLASVDVEAEPPRQEESPRTQQRQPESPKQPDPILQEIWRAQLCEVEEKTFGTAENPSIAYVVNCTSLKGTKQCGTREKSIADEVKRIIGNGATCDLTVEQRKAGTWTLITVAAGSDDIPM